MTTKYIPAEKKDREKIQPGLNFNLPIILNFSISETFDNKMAFETACYNQNISVSKKLREHLFKIMNILDEDKFKLIMRDPRDYCKQHIKNIIKKENNGIVDISAMVRELNHKFIRDDNDKKE